MEQIDLKRTNSDDKDFRMLTQLLDEELDVMDKKAHEVCFPFNNIETIKYAIVAYRNGIPVGCGAIREYENQTVEIKRMFVISSERGKGVASALLEELEDWSKGLNYNTAILETGMKMPVAINLYTRHGFLEIPNYGQYKHIESSLCFMKDLRNRD
ncbi:MAG: GNAT family N-acetyltransferase [Dysgonomonas sp.]